MKQKLFTFSRQLTFTINWLNSNIFKYDFYSIFFSHSVLYKLQFITFLGCSPLKCSKRFCRIMVSFGFPKDYQTSEEKGKTKLFFALVFLFNHLTIFWWNILSYNSNILFLTIIEFSKNNRKL